MKKVKRTWRERLFVGPSELAPWWAGLWYVDFPRNGYWVLPAPINLVVRPLTLLWFWVCHPWRDNIVEVNRRAESRSNWSTGCIEIEVKFAGTYRARVRVKVANLLLRAAAFVLRAERVLVSARVEGNGYTLTDVIVDKGGGC